MSLYMHTYAYTCAYANTYNNTDTQTIMRRYTCTSMYMHIYINTPSACALTQTQALTYTQT